MIRLTVRAFAELLHLPAHAQVRILYEQKYPRREPQVFKVPFYQVALRGIRDFYASGGDRRQLAEARARAAQLRPPPKRSNNQRALRAFENSNQVARPIIPSPGGTYRALPIRGVELRIRFGLEGEEGDRPRRMLYNLRQAPIDPEVALSTLRVAYWVLAENGLALPMRALEYVDLYDGRVHSVSRQSQRTLRLMMENARIIVTLWPTI